jgi:hypothetical protein
VTRHTGFVQAVPLVSFVFVLIAGLVLGISQSTATSMSKEYQEGYHAYQSKDFGRAKSHWQLAAANNDPLAQYALGLMHYRGDVGRIDYGEAAKWFGMAAKANHGNATYYVGLLYFNGHGLSYDQFRAHDFFKRALRINPANANAAYLIGTQYFHGRGARQNFVEAAHYFAIAARENMFAAQFMFGAMLERGWGIEQNYADAYYWLNRATLGPMRFPAGAEPPTPLDPVAAIAALKPRLRPEEIRRVENRLSNEVRR